MLPTAARKRTGSGSLKRQASGTTAMVTVENKADQKERLKNLLVIIIKKGSFYETR